MDAMEEDQPFELEACNKKTLNCIEFAGHAERPGAYLQAYASNYLGHAKVERLLFIADKKQGTAFGDDALRLALEELSQVSSHCK